MIFHIFFLVLGIILLYKGGDLIVGSASNISYHLGLSKRIVGLTLVAFGTSAPEFFVNILSAFDREYAIGFGNIIGSNMVNLCLTLGIFLLFLKIKIKEKTIINEGFLYVVTTLTLLFLSLDGILNIYDGMILLILFIIFIRGILIDVFEIEERRLREKISIRDILEFLLSVILLYAGARIVVKAIEDLYILYGFDEFMLSAIVISIGTALPEMVTSLVGVLKREREIALGNLLGSNIFNLSFILGISLTLTNLSALKYINHIFLLFLSSFIFFFLIILKERKEIGKLEALILLGIYVLFLTIL